MNCPFGRITPNCLGVWKDEHIPALRRMTDFVREHGAEPGIQLAHAGVKASRYRPFHRTPNAFVSLDKGGWQPVGPTATRYGRDGLSPQKLSVAEIATITGHSLRDVRSILRWLSEPQGRADGIVIWAQGVTALSAALAAATDDSVSGLVLEEPLLSFESVVTGEVPTYRDDILVPGVLERFDLPQVYQAVYPKKTTLINPLRGDRTPASEDEVAEAYQSVSETYEALGEPGDWRVFTQIDGQERAKRILFSFSASSDGR